jgi:hypothetical protein
MKKLIYLAFVLLSGAAYATEARLVDKSVDFAKVRVVLNGNEYFFYKKNQGDNFYDAVNVGTNTVTRNYPSATDDEINLSTCVLYGFNGLDDWKQCKKGFLNRKIKELKDNDDDLVIIDVDSRIAWLKQYRALNR